MEKVGVRPLLKIQRNIETRMCIACRNTGLLQSRDHICLSPPFYESLEDEQLFLASSFAGIMRIDGLKPSFHGSRLKGSSIPARSGEGHHRRGWLAARTDIYIVSTRRLYGRRRQRLDRRGAARMPSPVGAAVAHLCEAHAQAAHLSHGETVRNANESRWFVRIAGDRLSE